MPNNKNKSRTIRSKPKRKTNSALVTSNKMQEIKFSPEIVDVPFPRIRRDKAHTIIQSYSTTYAAGTFFGGISFSFSLIPDAAAYEAVFDQFRFDTVRLQFLPTVDGIYTAIDITDATAPASLAQLLQYDTLQVVPANVISERVFHPACQLQSGAESAVYRGWVSTDATAVVSPWYGLKFSSNSTVALAVITTLVVNLRATI
jgi:hypothetical protein